MWEARASYADGFYVEKYFDDNPYKLDADYQYELEEFLIEYHPDCIWYSVDWFN